jgi:hypothetical protein
VCPSTTYFLLIKYVLRKKKVYPLPSAFLKQNVAMNKYDAHAYVSADLLVHIRLCNCIRQNHSSGSNVLELEVQMGVS